MARTAERPWGDSKRCCQKGWVSKNSFTFPKGLVIPQLPLGANDNKTLFPNHLVVVAVCAVRSVSHACCSGFAVFANCNQVYWWTVFIARCSRARSVRWFTVSAVLAAFAVVRYSSGSPSWTRRPRLRHHRPHRWARRPHPRHHRTHRDADLGFFC